MPLAWLGVRHPHRPVLVRPVADQGAALPGGGRAGHDPGAGPLRGGNGAGERRAGLPRRRGLSEPMAEAPGPERRQARATPW